MGGLRRRRTADRNHDGHVGKRSAAKRKDGISETVTWSLPRPRHRRVNCLLAAARGLELTSPNRDDSLALHELQDAIDGILETDPVYPISRHLAPLDSRNCRSV